jgi:hypothetical protein
LPSYFSFVSLIRGIVNKNYQGICPNCLKMKTIVSKFESYFLPAAGEARELLSVDPSVGLAASGVGLTSAGVVSGVVLTEGRGISRTVGRLLLLKRRDGRKKGQELFLAYGLWY